MSDPNRVGTVSVIAVTHLTSDSDNYRVLSLIRPVQISGKMRKLGFYVRSGDGARVFDHEQFNFELQCALGDVHYGAGDVGETLSTASRVVDGDADSWCQEWITTAQRLARVAEDAPHRAMAATGR